MWKGKLSSCLESENIFGIPFSYWWDRKTFLLVFRLANFVQKAMERRPHQVKAAPGQGVEGTMGQRGEGIQAGDNSDGFRVFVSCRKQTPQQNHMRFPTDQGPRRDITAFTACLQIGPSYCHTKVMMGNVILLFFRSQGPLKCTCCNEQATILNWPLTWWEATG